MQLRKLAVALDVFDKVDGDARHRAAARLVANTVAKVQARVIAPALDEFVFEIGVGPAADLGKGRLDGLARMWSPLDEELIRLSERCDLSAIRFASTSPDDGLHDVLARLFPQVHARKLLRLERADEDMFEN